MEDWNNWSGGDREGTDTSGLNPETFGTSSSFGMETKNDSIEDYASTWTGEASYTVPGYNGVEPESIKKEGRGLEIAALVFGILSLVVCCCNGFFGLMGLILSIIALAKGKRSGLAVTGLVCSIIGLFLAFILFIFSMTESGQEFSEAFEEGYTATSEAQYESAEDEVLDSEMEDVEMEEYDESPVTVNEGTTVISDKEASKVLIDGKEVTIPCKLSDILKDYEVSSYSEELINGGLEPNSMEVIYLAQNGVENGIYVMVDNNTDKSIADIKDAPVNSISIDDSGEAPIGSASIFNGVSLGMNASQVEDAIKDIKYNKSEMSGYVFYNVFAGDENSYSISIMLSEDRVINISIYYSIY